MVVENWLLPKLSDILNAHQLSIEPQVQTENGCGRVQVEPNWLETSRLAQAKANSQWFSGIAALERLLQSQIARNSESQSPQGVVISGPCPILADCDLIEQFVQIIFRAEAFGKHTKTSFQLPAAEQTLPAPLSLVELPLLEEDPLTQEKFCLVCTPEFSLVMVLGENSNSQPAFHFAFEPQIVQQIWATLRSRLLLLEYAGLPQLEAMIDRFNTSEPDYRIVAGFSRLLLQHMPHQAESKRVRVNHSSAFHQAQNKVIPLQPNRIQTNNINMAATASWNELSVDSHPAAWQEMELLQALTHEIRTPLTTIRTLTRLLLKRKHLTPDIAKRLETIDQECTEQINRMELIFRAAELEASAQSRSMQLVPFSLEQVLQNCIPRWQKQAQRRNVVLEVLTPQKQPQIVSDPGMLTQVLSGLMENCTRKLAGGGTITLEITTAGSQLKLQFLSKSNSCSHQVKSLGQLLMFQPETGSLGLNWQVTKNLFQALGGKLTMRQKADQEEVLTVFLPLNNPTAIKYQAHSGG